MSFIAIVCDLPDAQRLLPQVIVCNFHTLRARDVAALRARLPGNVVLLRQRSSWNNNRLCSTIVRMVAEALAPLAHLYQPVFFLDAARCHTRWNVFAAFARFGIWPIVVPSKMTWLLQPLDTHVFALFKRRVRGAVQRARCEADVDASIVEIVLLALGESIDAVLLGRMWAAAFESNGFGQGQTCVSQRVLDSLELSAAPVVSRDRPSADCLRPCFPRRAHIIAAKILAASEKPFAPPAPPAARAKHCAAPPSPPSAPVTRSMTRAAASSSAPSVPVLKAAPVCKRPAAKV